jgi:hypothetical protein
MNKKEIAFRDPVVERVVDKFVSRSDVGYAKYGQTLDIERKTKQKDLVGYLTDIQEELMDAILYIQAAREELQDLSEEQIIRKSACASHAIQQDEDELEERMNIVGQNGNDGLHYESDHDGYMLDNDKLWGQE